MADFAWTNPTVGGSTGTWGTELNSILTLLKSYPGIQVVADATAKSALVPLNGQVVLQLDNAKLYKYVSSAWAEVAPTATADSTLTTKGDLLVYGSALARLGVGTNGQVLTADSAQALGVKWATPSGSSGSGVPERWVLPASADAGYDDEFDDGSIAAAWNNVDVSGYENSYYEATDIKGLSVSCPYGSGNQKLHGKLKSLSGMTAPCYIETAVRLLHRSCDYPEAGLIFADGITVGSGNQVRFMYSPISSKVEYAVHTGYNAQSSNVDYNIPNGALSGRIYLRMYWSASNAFSVYLSSDGVAWAHLDSITPTITPTYFGLCMGSYNSPAYPFVVHFDYFRARAGAPANG